MYFLVNVSPPKQLDVAISNFMAEYDINMILSGASEVSHDWKVNS